MTERVCLERLQVGEYVCCIPQTRSHVHHVLSPTTPTTGKNSKVRLHEPIQIVEREGKLGPGLRFVCPDAATNRPEVIFDVPFAHFSAIDVKIEGFDATRMLFIPATAVVASQDSDEKSLTELVDTVEMPKTLVTPMIALLIETLHPPSVELDTRTEVLSQRAPVRGFLIRAHLDLRSLPPLNNLLELVYSHQTTRLDTPPTPVPEERTCCKRRREAPVFQLGLPGWVHSLPWLPQIGSWVRRIYTPALRKSLDFIATFRGYLIFAAAVVQLYQHSSHVRLIFQPPLDFVYAHCTPVYNVLQAVLVDPLVAGAQAIWVSLPLMYVVTLNQCLSALTPAVVSARKASGCLCTVFSPILTQLRQALWAGHRVLMALGHTLKELGSSRVGRSLLSLVVSVEANEGEMAKKHLPNWAIFTKFFVPIFRFLGRLLKPESKPTLSRLPSTVDGIAHLAQIQQRKMDTGESPSFSLFDSETDDSKKSSSDKRSRIDKNPSFDSPVSIVAPPLFTHLSRTTLSPTPEIPESPLPAESSNNFPTLSPFLFPIKSGLSSTPKTAAPPHHTVPIPSSSSSAGLSSTPKTAAPPHTAPPNPSSSSSGIANKENSGGSAKNGSRSKRHVSRSPSPRKTRSSTKKAMAPRKISFSASPSPLQRQKQNRRGEAALPTAKKRKSAHLR